MRQESYQASKAAVSHTDCHMESGGDLPKGNSSHIPPPGITPSTGQGFTIPDSGGYPRRGRPSVLQRTRLDSTSAQKDIRVERHRDSLQINRVHPHRHTYHRYSKHSHHPAHHSRQQHTRPFHTPAAPRDTGADSPANPRMARQPSTAAATPVHHRSRLERSFQHSKSNRYHSKRGNHPGLAVPTQATLAPAM